MPIQVIAPLPPKKKSTSQQFGEAFGRAAEGITEHLAGEQKKKKAAAALKELTGFDLTDLPEDQQKIVLNQFAKFQAQAQAQEGLLEKLGLTGALGQQASQNQLAGQQAGMQKQPQVSPEGEMDVGDVGLKTGKLYDEKDIQAMTVVNRDIANQMQKHNDNVREEQRHQQKVEQSAVNAAKKETAKLRGEIASQAKYAKDAISNKKNQLRLLEKGNIDSPGRVYLASLLPGALGNKLLSADTQLYRAGLFEEFGVLKNMFPGQIRVKEIELLEDKLASLEKSHEAKKKILETGIAKLEVPQIRAKAAQRVEQEHPKASVIGFEQLVDEYAHDDLEAAYKRISDSYNKIYYEYAPEQSTLIDKNGHVYKNIPKNLLESFYEEGNKEGLELRPI